VLCGFVVQLILFVELLPDICDFFSGAIDGGDRFINDALAT
jgi:hypothetical protein